MIDGKSVLAIITARGGSKGLPRKNLRVAAGKPLIGWTIDAAHASRYVDRLVVSSDDKEIIQAALDLGCEAPFTRPPELARDDTPSIEPVLHALSILPRHEWIVLLQPTSPLRLASDIDGCIEMCSAAGADACVSVTEVSESPYWMFRLKAGHELEPLLDDKITAHRRQDLPAIYMLNGAVYVARSEWLCRSRSFLGSTTLGYPMPRERSIDIDSELDFKLFEAMIAGKTG